MHLKVRNLRYSVRCVNCICAAHHDAYEKAKILHRDVSFGNIMIVDSKEGKAEGRLIDWDLCKDTSKLDETTSLERTVCRNGRICVVHLLN